MEGYKHYEYIMETMRQRLGLEEDDTSKDEQINRMSKKRIFDEMCNWNGLINYGDTILDWISDIYGIDFDDFEE